MLQALGSPHCPPGTAVAPDRANTKPAQHSFNSWVAWYCCVHTNSAASMLHQLLLWRNFSALTALLSLLDTSVRCTKEQRRRLVLQYGSEVAGGTNTIETFRFQESLCALEKSQKCLDQLWALSLLTYRAFQVTEQFLSAALVAECG